MIQKKRKNKSVSFSKSLFFLVLYIFFGISFFGFLIFSNWRIYQRRAELASEIKKIEGNIQLLDKKNKELKEGFSNLSNENYLEQIAREKLGLKKPGEEVIVVVPAPEEEKKVDESENKGFWSKILQKLGI